MVFVFLKIGTTFPSAIIFRRGRLICIWRVASVSHAILYVVFLLPLHRSKHCRTHRRNVSLFLLFYIVLFFVSNIIVIYTVKKIVHVLVTPNRLNDNFRKRWRNHWIVIPSINLYCTCIIPFPRSRLYYTLDFRSKDICLDLVLCDHIIVLYYNSGKQHTIFFYNVYAYRHRRISVYVRHGSYGFVLFFNA